MIFAIPHPSVCVCVCVLVCVLSVQGWCPSIIDVNASAGINMGVWTLCCQRIHRTLRIPLHDFQLFAGTSTENGMLNGTVFV